MTALYIIIGIIALIAVILLVPLRLRIVLNEGNFNIHTYFGFLEINVFNDKPKKFKYKKLAKKLRKKKLSYYLKQTDKKKQRVKEKKKSSISEMISDLKNNVGTHRFFDILIRLLKYLAMVAKKHLKIQISSLFVYVYVEDPAKTGIACGAISQSLYYLTEFLDCYTKLQPDSKKNIKVIPDFANQSINSNVDIGISIKLGAALGAAITLFFKFLVLTIKNQNKSAVAIRKETTK